MFSRIKGAIDRTLAEEQARHRASTERPANNNSNAPSNNGSGLPLQEADPAVFEAALGSDGNDSDATITPSSTPSLDDQNPVKTSPHRQEQNAEIDAVTNEGDVSAEKPAEPPPAAPSSSVSPNIAAKLKRAEKLERTYKELLRSYRIAHSRAIAVEPFERALRENTPLRSISDPAALVEYISQLNLKNDMVMDEFKRVSAAMDVFKKKNAQVDKELAEMKSKMDASNTAATDKGTGKDDIFSYDDTVNEQVATLNLEISALKTELAAAQEKLENATRESSNSQDNGANQGPTQAEFDASVAEVDSLKLQVKTLDKDKHELAVSYDAVLETVKQQGDNEKNIQDHNDRLSKEITSLRDEIDTYKQKTIESDLMSKEITSLREEIETYKEARRESSASASAAVSSHLSKSAKKKKNKKKKGGNSGAPGDVPEEPTQLDSLDYEGLTTELSNLQDEVAGKAKQIDELTGQLRTAEDKLRLKETLFENVQYSNTESFALINRLETDHIKTQARLSERENEIVVLKALAERTNTDHNTANDLMRKECDEAQTKVRALETDLGALRNVAQDRWKEIVSYKDLLAKLQTELKSLRQVSTKLKETQELHASLQNEVHAFEKREKELKKDIASVSRLSSDRESEIKLISDRLSTEKTLRTKLEDEKRKLSSSNQRLEGEKNQISVEADKTARKLETAQSELSGLRPKIIKLEDEIAKLQREKNLAKQDVDLKTQQYNNAQSLLASMRDQTTELSTRLKEAQGQAESLEEELAEAQKHLAERTREAETMRRMLADVNERTDCKVREMKSRMEAAIEERDRIDDESSTLARKRSRENEELKDKLRELERQVKTLSSEKDEIELRERDLNRRRLVLEEAEGKATVEIEETRGVVSNLRSALDASEQQVQDAEKQKAELRKLLDEARGRYEKVTKELKNVQSRLNPGSGSSVASGGRTSIDSTRSGSNGTAARGGPDITYLKTIFLQFLEVKDEKVRSQLVPVLSKLLGFDKNEDQRWLQAIHRMSKSGK